MYIITSKTKRKVLRDPNSQKQLQAERTHYYKEQGIEKIKSLKGKSEEETYQDIKNAGSFVKDSMQERKELKRAEKEKKWKENQEKRLKDAPSIFLKNKEKQLKVEAEKRKITVSSKK